MIYYPPAVLKLSKIQMWFFFRFLIFKPQIEKMTLPIFLLKMVDFDKNCMQICMSRQNAYLSTIPIGSVVFTFIGYKKTNRKAEEIYRLWCNTKSYLNLFVYNFQTFVLF